MPLRISFNLKDADLQHFADVAQRTQALARTLPADEIIAAARRVFQEGSSSQVAEFVRERYLRLGAAIALLEDAEWQLREEDRQRVLNALACFSSTHAANAPTLLDNAIMIELVSRDLSHDLEAHREFSRLRASYERKHPTASAEERTAALGSKREALQTRMHERRRRDLERANGAVRRFFSLFR